MEKPRPPKGLPAGTSQADLEHVDDLITYYAGQVEFVQTTVEQVVSLLSNSAELKPLIHSIKSRAKTVPRMHGKLLRQLVKAKKDGAKFEVDRQNFFRKINDAAGVRILHMNSLQFAQIHPILLALFARVGYVLLEKPNARTWDIEYDKYFQLVGIDTKQSDSYYTSVHYVIGTNEQVGCSAEIQVRTVAEEVWGEVDHLFNYPDHVKDLACSEEIKVLGRAVSTCARLVDAIYRTHDAYTTREQGAAGSQTADSVPVEKAVAGKRSSKGAKRPKAAQALSRKRKRRKVSVKRKKTKR